MTDKEQAALQAEIESLREINRGLVLQLKKAQEEKCRLIDVEIIHEELDRLDVPRIDVTGARQFISQRFAILALRVWGGRR